MDAEAAFTFFQDQFEVYEPELPFIRTYINSISSDLAFIDDLISKTSSHWKMSRIPKIDKSILRLGVYELTRCKDVPSSVVIDEAVELAKKFGEEKSPGFINGLLDNIAKSGDSL